MIFLDLTMRSFANILRGNQTETFECGWMLFVAIALLGCDGVLALILDSVGNFLVLLPFFLHQQLTNLS